MHREVPVKVTAWVDKGVAPLVSALDAYPRVVTLDSCENDAAGLAHVFFSVRGDGREAALFAAELGAALAPHERDADYSLSAEWRPGAEDPVLRIDCPPADIGRLASALSEACGRAGGSSGRALRS